MVLVLLIDLSPKYVPVAGCEIKPHVLVRHPDRKITADDIPETKPVAGCFLKHKWYRVLNDDKATKMMCSVHPNEEGTVQCLECVKAKVHAAMSYHCSPACFSKAWSQHLALHDHARKANEATEGGATGPASGTVGTRPADEGLYLVGRSKAFTPQSGDVAHVLKYEVVVLHEVTRTTVGCRSALTSRVIVAPPLHPRRLVPVIDDHALSRVAQLDDRNIASLGKFSVLSYNILSDMCSTYELYSYCPSWALSWTYRRQNLLREIVGYNADIVCLQEVERDHFHHFFGPELEKHGYHAVYKKKTTETLKFKGLDFAVDGCATFFRRDRLSVAKTFEIEYNQAAHAFIESAVPVNKREIAVSRLIKDNVALITLLTAIFKKHGADPCGNEQLIVANTHIVHEDLKDVKQLQVQTLLKALERIKATNLNVPILICGDLSSTPGSVSHSFIATGMVDERHPDLAADPCRIVPHLTKRTHPLSLVSAYSSFASLKGDNTLHQRRMDLNAKEPLFTTCTKDFIGTVDYIFYTSDTLRVESLLELVDEEYVRRVTGLPSGQWSSDHLAILAEFRCTVKGVV